jgi:hypothetical protein
MAGWSSRCRLATAARGAILFFFAKTGYCGQSRIFVGLRLSSPLQTGTIFSDGTRVLAARRDGSIHPIEMSSSMNWINPLSIASVRKGQREDMVSGRPAKEECT